MSLSGHSLSGDLETISEAPGIDRKISGTPEPLDSHELIESVRVPESATNYSRTNLLPRRANTSDDYSTGQRKVYFESSIANRANTGDFYSKTVSALPPPASSGLRNQSLAYETPRSQTANTSIQTDVADEHYRGGSGKLRRRNTTDDNPPSKSPRRQSTVVTNASLSLEETEAWDKKSLLSLGSF